MLVVVVFSAKMVFFTVNVEEELPLIPPVEEAVFLDTVELIKVTVGVEVDSI